MGLELPAAHPWPFQIWVPPPNPPGAQTTWPFVVKTFVVLNNDIWSGNIILKIYELLIDKKVAEYMANQSMYYLGGYQYFVEVTVWSFFVKFAIRINNEKELKSLYGTTALLINRPFGNLSELV